MQQYNVKTVPDNLSAAIKIVSEALRRMQKRNELTYASTDGMKSQTAMEVKQRQSCSDRNTSE